MNRQEYLAASGEAFRSTNDRAERDAATMAVHRAYHAQFVTPGTIWMVTLSIGRDGILASTDPHMNDVGLHRWDLLVEQRLETVPLTKWHELGDYPTKAGLVCVAKEAARMWRDQQEAASCPPT